MALLPQQDAISVRLFKFQDDRKRALLSRLMQRACIHQLFGVHWNAISLDRTKTKKPFYARQNCVMVAPNFNFNVSHEGDFVVLASEPMCLVGVDVSASQVFRQGTKESTTQLFETFERQCSPIEWQNIQTAGDGEAQLACFRKHWSLKEAFVKARGDGIAFDLRKADFRLQQTDFKNAMVAAVLLLDGIPQSKWRFTVQELCGGHMVSVARGPPSAAVDAIGDFKRTLQCQHFTEDQWQSILDQPWPPFSILSVCDMVPACQMNSFVAAGGGKI